MCFTRLYDRLDWLARLNEETCTEEALFDILKRSLARAIPWSSNWLNLGNHMHSNLWFNHNHFPSIRNYRLCPLPCRLDLLAQQTPATLVLRTQRAGITPKTKPHSNAIAITEPEKRAVHVPSNILWELGLRRSCCWATRGCLARRPSAAISEQFDHVSEQIKIRNWPIPLLLPFPGTWP